MAIKLEAGIHTITDMMEIREVVRVPEAFDGQEPYILGHIALSEALLFGHFELNSGLHGRYFLRTACLEGRSDWHAHLGKMIAERLNKDKIWFDKSLSLDDSGLSLAHNILDYSMKPSTIARSADVDKKGLPTDTNQHIFGLYPNDTVILIDDVMQSPRTLNDLHDIALAHQAKPVAAITHACMEGEQLRRFGRQKDYPVYALVDLQQKSSLWTPKGCPLCAEGSKPTPTWTL